MPLAARSRSSPSTSTSTASLTWMRSRPTRKRSSRGCGASRASISRPTGASSAVPWVAPSAGSCTASAAPTASGLFANSVRSTRRGSRIGRSTARCTKSGRRAGATGSRPCAIATRRRWTRRAVGCASRSTSSAMCSGSRTRNGGPDAPKRTPRASRCSAICPSWSRRIPPTCGASSGSSASTPPSVCRRTPIARRARTGVFRCRGGKRCGRRAIPGCTSAPSARPSCTTHSASTTSSASTGRMRVPSTSGRPFSSPPTSPGSANRASGCWRSSARRRKCWRRISGRCPTSCAPRWRRRRFPERRCFAGKTTGACRAT